MLAGSQHWNGLVGWIRAQRLSGGMVSPEDVTLLTVLDDPDAIAEVIMHWRRRQLETYQSPAS